MSHGTLDDRPEASREGRRLTALLYVALEGHDLLAGGRRFDLEGIDEVLVGRGDARSAVVRGTSLHLTLPSPSMSSRHARFARVGGRFVVEDLGSRNGVLLDGARVAQAVVERGRCVEAGRAFFFVDPLVHVASPPAALLPEDLARWPVGLRSLLPSLAERHEALRRVAASKVPVLVRGPTGAGKELVARAVHALSGRGGAFVPVNCGALPASMVEALLFGHARGAFSGAARDEPGFVRAAHDGTLFLDEIGDLRLESQVALLRVLQEQEVTPIGTTRAIPVDVRVVAATHRELDALVAAGSFREDLMARLAGFVHAAPPLRERQEDLGVVVADLLAARRAGGGATLAADAARALLTYEWPRNARELSQALAAALALAAGGPVERAHLPAAVVEARARAPGDDDASLEARLVALLTEHQGNVAAVGRAMGKAPLQIRRWLARFALDADAYRRR